MVLINHGVLFNGGKWYLHYFECVVGAFVKGWRIFSNGGGIGMVGGLCVWVKMWEEVIVLMTAFG